MTPPASGRTRTWLKLAVFALIVAAAAIGLWRSGLLHDRAALIAVIDRARGMPLLIPLFLVAYTVAVAFGLPASPLTLAGGALFGVWGGIALNWCGAMAGAFAAFLFAHLLCRDDCRDLLGRRQDALDRLAARHGFLGTLRLRLVPVVPFALVNYGAALAGVGRRDYLLATAIGILPGTAVYTWFADSLLQGAAGAGRHALVRVSIAGALLLVLSFVPTLVARLRRD
jgi:uncharacterized membrane protein YdjX (TVP38/TMEM64 family)